MKTSVTGGNNTLTITHQGKTYEGDLNHLGDPEVWRFGNRLVECEPVLDETGLKDLSGEFLRQELGVLIQEMEVIWED